MVFISYWYDFKTHVAALHHCNAVLSGLFRQL